ncbi:hypothetical protein CAFE_07320 [Caprobacter fermentans]|uniref:Glycosyltransferase 2-like domain-containing protein n=1 Tax=Caproicibacter fermentans TaxID=2576756 RepID=A0A6N8HWK0_9FIRM|nr:glycosyltransferase [Caproicibacter fermentans]MVB10059.1 hypothetical protein [Caproicibacter fermentans]
MEHIKRLKEYPLENQSLRDDFPLVSVIVISYNNFHFLVHSVRSVLEQEYPSLELTVSDDASAGYTDSRGAFLVCQAVRSILSERKFAELEEATGRSAQKQREKADRRISEEEFDFEKDYLQEARELIHTHFPQIQDLRFNKSPTNLGTVKHLKGLKENAQGKYLMFLAADDMLHDKKVIYDMITHFESLPEDAYVLSSQCGMYDFELKQLRYFAVNDHIKKILLESMPKQLFAELTDWCLVPAAGTIYKKTVFQKFGDLDPRYHLIEDWTYFLKLTRSGAKIYYYDRLTYMHRDGGISHGNTTGGSDAYLRYLDDWILLTETEILPYLDEVTSKQRKQALKRYRDAVREREWKYRFRNMPSAGKLRFLFRYWPHYTAKMLKSVGDFVNYRAKWAFVCSVLLLFLYSFCSLVDRPQSPPLQVFETVIGFCGLLLLIGTVLSKILCYIFKLAAKIYARVKRED